MQRFYEFIHSNKEDFKSATNPEEYSYSSDYPLGMYLHQWLTVRNVVISVTYPDKCSYISDQHWGM